MKTRSGKWHKIIIKYSTSCTLTYHYSCHFPFHLNMGWTYSMYNSYYLNLSRYIKEWTGEFDQLRYHLISVSLFFFNTRTYLQFEPFHYPKQLVEQLSLVISNYTIPRRPVAIRPFFACLTCQVQLRNFSSLRAPFNFHIGWTLNLFERKYRSSLLKVWGNSVGLFHIS